MGWETATAIGTFLLVLVTAIYNHKILREAMAMRHAEFKPIIYVSDWTDSDDPGPGNQWFQFYLKNIGRGPAFGIEVCIDGVKPETIVKGVTAVDPDKSLPTCLAAGEKSPLIRIFYGEEDIAARKFDEINLTVRYRNIASHAIESSVRLIQKELRLAPTDPPFYFVKPTTEFVVKDL